MDQTNAYRYVPQGKSKVQTGRIEKSWNIRAQELRKRQISKDRWQGTSNQALISRNLDRLVEFVQEQESKSSTGLAAGYIQVGPNSDAFATLSHRLREQLLTEPNRRYLVLQSSVGSNLKRLLNHVIISILKPGSDVSASNGDDEDGLDPSRTSSANVRTFQQDARKQSIRHVILVIEGSESFNASVLAGFIEILDIWSSEIVFTILFGVQTSVDNFRTRLPASSKRAFSDTRLFDLSESQRMQDQNYWQYIFEEEPQALLNPQLMGAALPESGENLDTAKSLFQITKHAEIGHFYANDLSIFLSDQLKSTDVSREQFEMLRRLPSFTRTVEHLLTETKEVVLAQDLTTDNAALFEYTIAKVAALQIRLEAMHDALAIARGIHEILYKRSLPWDVQSHRQMLTGSTIKSIKVVFDGLRLATHDQLQLILDRCDQHIPVDERSAFEAIRNATTQSEQHPNSTQKTMTTKKNNTAFIEWLRPYFDKCFINLQSMYPVEILKSDFSMSQAAFWPNPREAIETALSNPARYLDCDICQRDPNAEQQQDDESATRTNHINPTPMMFQLLQESGASVNVNDWWEAFKSLFDGQEVEEQNMMALFQRGLAELTFLGLIRPSRRKADHVLRTMWTGIG